MPILIIYKKIQLNAIKFNLSILHTRIRFFENFLLHLAYNLPIKKWQIKRKIDKNILNSKKKNLG